MRFTYKLKCGQLYWALQTGGHADLVHVGILSDEVQIRQLVLNSMHCKKKVEKSFKTMLIANVSHRFFY